VTNEDRLTATAWVREAIVNGRFDRHDWRNGFPRYIWYRDAGGGYWYGFLMNEGAGAGATAQYKGWPIPEEEWREDFG
jgi:hypothetical protein